MYGKKKRKKLQILLWMKVECYEGYSNNPYNSRVVGEFVLIVPGVIMYNLRVISNISRVIQYLPISFNTSTNQQRWTRSKISENFNHFEILLLFRKSDATMVKLFYLKMFLILKKLCFASITPVPLLTATNSVLSLSIIAYMIILASSVTAFISIRWTGVVQA